MGKNQYLGSVINIPGPQHWAYWYLRGGLLREPVREQPCGDLAASSRMGMMQGDPLLDRCCVYSLQHSPPSAP
jgi:hypothetical protein